MHLKIFFVALFSSALFAPTATAGTSANKRVPAGDALLLGGSQPARVNFDGQNRGLTDIELIIVQEDQLKPVAVIAPRKRFEVSVKSNQTLLIRNTSDTKDAKVYWHISGYSKLAKPRLASEEE